jgi:hypothetical protein
MIVDMIVDVDTLTNAARSAEYLCLQLFSPR